MVKGFLRALALDLDGSLFEKDATLSEESVRLLRAARDRGVKIALLSGRMYCSVLPYWRRIEPGTPVVSYNGALIRDPAGGVLFHQPVEVSTARAVLRACDEAGVHVNAYVDDTVIVAREDGLGRWYADYYGVPIRAVGPVWQWIAEGPTKLLAIAAEADTMPAVRAAVRAGVDGAPVHVTESSDRFVEILHHGVHKGNALRLLAERLEIPLDRWAALGDAGNDAEMIEAAGCGIAVEGSPAARFPHDEESPQGAAGVRRILTDLFGLRL